MGPAHLQAELSSHQYYADRSLSRKIAACLSVKPVKGAFLMGPPGAGKSYLPEALAPILGAELVFYQVFPGLREEDLLVKLVPDAFAPSGIRSEEGPVTEATRLSQDRKVVLVLDEWDKARPSADSFLLDYLQSGRVRFNGQRLVANQAHLSVFLTSNDDREVSEPLLRRLPRIDIPVLPVEVVQLALNSTHRDHPHLTNALILYQRSLLAQLRKPATIQEIRQFLDAITALGPEADWNELVFQMVTKSMDDHMKLKAVEGNTNLPQLKPVVVLDPSAFTQPGTVAQGTLSQPTLPRAAEVFALGPVNPEMSFGIVAYTDAAYNQILRTLTPLTPNANPANLGTVAHVASGGGALRYLSFDRALTYHEFFQIADVQGEVLVKLSPQRWERVRDWLLNYPEWQLTRFAQDEITAKNEDYAAEMRWTPTSLEVIWPKGRDSESQFSEYFSQLAVRKNPRRGVCTHQKVYLGRDDDGAKLYAYYTVQRLRRASPAEGNVYFAQGALDLPIGQGRDYLHPALVFENRVPDVLGESLNTNWGGGAVINHDQHSRRRVFREAKAGTWPETHALVHAQIRHDLLGLVRALRQRQSVHRRAGA